MMQVIRNIKTFHDYEVINFHCTIRIVVVKERFYIHLGQHRGPESQYQVIEMDRFVCTMKELFQYLSGVIAQSSFDEGKVVITT